MTDLNKYLPAEQWHDWTELDAKAWPDKVEAHLRAHHLLQL